MNLARSLLIGLSIVSPQAIAQGGGAASPCTPPVVREASPDEVRAYFAARNLQVLTFLGYSGAGYEDEGQMLAEAERVLSGADPRQTIVNIGATADGIGAVYRVAKQKGFTTTGIVSSQARKHQAALAECVDHVFYVEDESWGGLLPGTRQLSPTSRAMVENSDRLVAIGGGEIVRDELTAAQAAGKPVEFIPAEMQHAAAIAKARKHGHPAPTDFRGAAAGVID